MLGLIIGNRVDGDLRQLDRFEHAATPHVAGLQALLATNLVEDLFGSGEMVVRKVLRLGLRWGSRRAAVATQSAYQALIDNACQIAG